MESLHRQIGNQAVAQLLSRPGSSPMLLQRMLPRLGNQAAVRQMSANGSQKPVIQRKINISPFTISLHPDFVDLVSEYNQIEDEAPLHEKINGLSVVERAVFQWFTTRNSKDLEEDEEAVQMRKLMDLLHVERHTIVERSIENEDHEQNGDLPIAGFDTLDRDIQQKVRKMWKDLVKNEGKIQITEEQRKGEKTIVHDGFSTQVLAEFSRMLESEFGRSLLARINESDKTITISPFQVGDGGVFAASPTSPDSESSHLRKLPKEPDQDQKPLFNEIILDDLNKEQRIALINGLRRENRDQLGVALVLGDKTQYYAFGAGSDVRVTMPSNLSESSLHYENRLIDAADHELIAPIFSTLNHELGHAAHMQEGTVTGQAGSLMGLIDERDSLDGWSNMEEYINIKGTENALRNEFDLGERKGHINTPYVLKEEMLEQIMTIEKDIKKKTDLKAEYKEPLLEAIDELFSFVAENWVDEQKFKEAKERVKRLPARMEEMHRQALVKQEEDERTKVELALGIKRSEPIPIPKPKPKSGSDDEEMIVGGPPRTSVGEYIEQHQESRRQNFRSKYFSKLGL
ncbi:hypothetical protein ACF3MZ_19760 [Paenibacillaceae bacterium WGS1546]|uniref:hypothetical protein n=1 Tax=Cohnella sp. WGS1546 TaxID=3366810 RepID=UPI00372D0335